MKISCPACQAKYSIADEKVTDRLAKIRCRKCGATIVIDGKSTPAHVYTAAGEAPDTGAAIEQDSGASYSVDFGEGDQRNLTVAEIVTAYNAGEVSAETYLWADGFADWKALGEIEEIVQALHAATHGSPEPEAAPVAATATPSPWAAPAVSAPRAAARASRGGAADLFGGLEHAGSEEEVTTSAPEHGSGRQSAPNLGASSSTGARNESSVLFSLSALTSASSPVAASRPSARPMTSSASRDDSGLIDLKALTAAATKNEALPAAPLAAPLGGASPLGIPSPLGMASPLGGGFASATEPGYPGGGKSKAPLFIGGGVVLAALIVAGAIVLKPQPPPPPPPPVVTAPTVVAAPTPTPTQVVTATPPATGTAEEPAPSSKPVVGAVAPKKYSGGAVAPKKAAPSGGDAPAAAPAAAPKPKRSACGCAPGDLMCNMQCSAK